MTPFPHIAHLPAALALIGTLLILGGAPAHAATTLRGVPSVIDGDTLDIHGKRVRLSGVDAPESSQICTRKGQRYGCGREAAEALAALTRNRSVTCTVRDTDRYGRTVASCATSSTPDLGNALVLAGQALPYLNYGGERYLPAYQAARSAGRGLHAGTYQFPWAYRQNHAAPPASVLEGTKTAPASSKAGAGGKAGVFASCAEARAAGQAPLHRGHSGYNPRLDGDRDGVACEPPRPSRGTRP